MVGEGQTGRTGGSKPRATAFLLAGVLLGCGGRAAGTAEHGQTASPCITSTGCAQGLRCDAGLCVADVACPALQAPRLLFAVPSTSPFASGYPLVVSISGHELIESQRIDPCATSLAFHDLRTGEESMLPHDAGVAYCALDPAVCFSMDGSQTTLLQDLSLDPATLTWSAGSARTFAVAGTPFVSSGDLAARRLPFWSSSEGTISILDVDTGQPTLTLPLDGDLAATIADAHGVTTSVNTSHGDASAWIVKHALLQKGAAFETIYSGEAARATAVLVTNGEPRYAVRENGPTDSGTIRIERVLNAVPTTLGILPDPPLSALSFGYASRALEPSSAMYALDCLSGQECRSFLLHLEAVSAELIAEAPWPEGLQPFVSGDRRLACGARDLVLLTVDPISHDGRFWSVRLPGRAGLP